uniref:fibronectin type III domain-containing protein n=1 Tax=Candidatus Planktophila sp. TaxID=2175601 RepID=UPI0040490A29
MRTTIQGVLVAVKKKSAAKKKVAKKAPARKAVAKKSTAKKSVAKKKVTAKRAVKKSVAKKTAKRAPAKKAAAKKVVKKKSVAKRPVKKSAKKAAAPRVTVTSSRPVAAPPVAVKAVAPSKPAAAPKQGASGRVVFAVVVGIVLLAMIVWSQSGTESDDGAAPAPSMSQSAEASESASPEETTAVVGTIEAPSKFVALKSADGLNLRWVAPMATEGLTGYNVEIRANGTGDWTTIATVPADQLTQAVTKSGDAGWTQFRVSSVYSDGQTAPATVFGIPGEFK